MIKLSLAVKKLMAFCYSKEGCFRYEISYDTRKEEPVSFRIFLTERQYLYVTFKKDTCKILEYNVSRNFYYPSVRVSFINKFFKSYRNGADFSASIPIDTFIKLLDTKVIPTISEKDFNKPNKYYNLYGEVARASSEF